MAGGQINVGERNDVTRSYQGALIVVILAFLLAGCSSLDVQADWDRAADFNDYATFGWLELEEAPTGIQLPDHLDRRLRRVVDDVLTDKGLERAPALPLADLLLVYYVGLERELRVNYSSPFYGPYGFGYWPGYAWGATYVREYATGTLVIDVVDRRTKQLVWTGVVRGAVQSANPPSDRIEKVVLQLMRDFPPE
jgi:hypothetical protein